MDTTRHKTVNRAATRQPAASVKVAQRPAAAAALQMAPRVSSPTDPAEKEAEVTAKQVMRRAIPEGAIAWTRTPQGGVFRLVKPEEKEPKLQRHWASPYIARFADCGIFRREKQEVEKIQRRAETRKDEEKIQRGSAEKQDDEKLQRQADGQPNVAGNVGADLQSSLASGAPLPLSVRRFMEPRFRADFSNVRIHTGDQSAQLNRQFSARAFALGNHIFFGKDRFQPETNEGRELIAHELTHTIQQGAAVQRDSEAKSDQHPKSEIRNPKEARSPNTEPATTDAAPVFRASDFGHVSAFGTRSSDLRTSPTLARGSEPAVTQHTAPHVQRLGIRDALNYFAERANHIPGFRMFTIILGVNPINMGRVERSAANILRALVEFIPGGHLITQALDNYGIFDRVGSWVEQQIAALGMTAGVVREAINRFLDSLSWTDIFDLGGVWERAKRIFTEPINRLIAFARGLVSGILRFIREAILRPLASLAEGTRGYDLLKAVLGQDPVTGDPYPRTAETLIGGFMRLIGQEEVWQNLQRARAVPRAWAWFQGALGGLMGFVRQVPSLFVQALQSLELADIVLLPRAFTRVARVFGEFLGQFISWAGAQVMSLLEIIFDVVAPAVMPYLRRAAGAFMTIIRNPIGFVGNLVRAGIQGFRQFAANFLNHLRTSLIQWLTGTLAGTGVYIPQAFNLREIIKFVLSVLGLTWQNLRQKLVRAIGETAVRALETGFDIVVTLVRDGPVAAWERIRESLANLRELVIEAIMNFVAVRIVQAAITRLITSLNPAGAFIQAIIAIYNTVMFFIERLRQIAQVAMSFINSIAAIASGAIAAAANRVEQTMAGLLTLVISFLARLVGLGRVSDAIAGIIARIRAPIDRALDRVVEWIRNAARSFLSRLLGGDPNAPAAQRVSNGLREGVAAVNRFAGRTVGAAVLRPLLVAIKARHRLSQLDIVPEGRFWAVVAAASPAQRQVTSAGKEDENAPDGSQQKPFPIAWPKRPAAQYNRLYLAPRAVITQPLRQSALRLVPGAELFAPTASNALPGGGASIGIASAYQTRLELLVGPKVSGRSDSEKNRFNRLLEAHGYDRSEEPTDGDHVVEMQVSGPDSFPNLWPLNSSENRSGGSRLNNLEVDQPDGTKRRARDLAGKYFKITSFSR